MLNIFNGKVSAPKYSLVAPPNGEMQTMTVQKDVCLPTF